MGSKCLRAAHAGRHGSAGVSSPRRGPGLSRRRCCSLRSNRRCPEKTRPDDWRPRSLHCRSRAQPRTQAGHEQHPRIQSCERAAARELNGSSSCPPNSRQVALGEETRNDAKADRRWRSRRSGYGRRTGRSAGPFTAKQGQYLAFIYYYTKTHGTPPAESDLRRFFSRDAASCTSNDHDAPRAPSSGNSRSSDNTGARSPADDALDCSGR